jgi:hypothetical protein
MDTHISEIEKYIREMIAGGSFNRESILMNSKEWIEKFPKEFNSILNIIEAEVRNVGCDEMMDDSTPSVAYGSRFADDSMPSATYHGCFANDSMPSEAYGGYANDSTPSAAYGGYANDSMPSEAYGGYANDSTPSAAYGGYANDSMPSEAYGSRYADDSTPSAAYHGCFDDDSTPSVAMGNKYSGNIMPDHMLSVSDSPKGSDHIDSSPGGYPDDDFESDTPLQRTMSSYAPPRK